MTGTERIIKCQEICRHYQKSSINIIFVYFIRVIWLYCREQMSIQKYHDILYFSYSILELIKISVCLFTLIRCRAVYSSAGLSTKNKTFLTTCYKCLNFAICIKFKYLSASTVYTVHLKGMH